MKLLEGHEVIGISEDSYITDAIFFMKQNNIRRIGVFKGRELIGLFTIEEALYHILYNETEYKLKDAKLKQIIVSDGTLKGVVKDMIENKVDAVFIKRDEGLRIVTYKDVIREIDWSKASDEIAKIARKAITASPYSRVRTVASIMVNNHIRHVPIYEDSLYGILSVRDIVYRYPELDLNTEVSKIMVTEVYSASHDAKIGKVASDLINLNIGSAIVNGNYIVTLKDLIEYALRNLLID